MNAFVKLTKWYFSRRTLPYWSILAFDYIITVICGVLACLIHQGPAEAFSHFPDILLKLALYSVFYIVGFRLFHTYTGVLRFSSFVDLGRIGLAIATGFILMLLIPKENSPVTNSDLLTGALLSIAVMWASRIWVKTLYDATLSLRRTSRAFIYGAKDGGIALAKSLNSNDQNPYMLVGFATDDTDLVGHHVMGQAVYLADADLVSKMAANGVTALLVPRYKSDALRHNTGFVNALIEAGIRIMMFPDAQDWDDASGSDSADNNVESLREVNVEDLLPREKIEIDMDAIGRQLKGKRIMITGAAGSIGSEMVRQIAQFGPSELVLIDQAETPLHDVRLFMARRWPDIKADTVVADIAHAAKMEELFKAHRPEYVFHAAAYKHVPMMEDNPGESITNNVEGTRIVADLAVKYGTRKFVMVSTDKAVNPTNVMGCSKRICEIYVQALDKAVRDGKVKGSTRFVTTRFGNVLGSNGSVIPLFQQQIKAGGPVTVTHPDIIRFFMLISEACKLVLEAGTMGSGGEIFVFDMGEPVKIADLARRMITMSGAKNVQIRFTGLRDGEKLYEEVLNEKETTLPTFHPKIKIARVREYDYEEANRSISELVDMCSASTDMEIVSRMKLIVPEFRSQHSKYEVLDKQSLSQHSA